MAETWAPDNVRMSETASERMSKPAGDCMHGYRRVERGGEGGEVELGRERRV